MGSRDYLKLGDWNALCDACGMKFKGSELRKRWDGFMVCKKDYEPRPPQEFVRGIKDDQTAPFTRPVLPDTSPTGYVQALAGATTITSANLGTDDRVIVDIIQQWYGLYTQGAVTITIDSSIIAGNVVIIKGTNECSSAVTIINNSTGTVTQL